MQRRASQVAALLLGLLALQPAAPSSFTAPPKVSTPRTVPRFAASDENDIGATIEQVVANTQEGEVGERGEAAVAAQFVLLLCIFAGSVPLVGSTLVFAAGPLAMLGGAGLVAGALYELRGSLSPWVVPPSSGALKTDGVFAYVRHPVYCGLLLFCLGLSVVTGSTIRLLLTGALLLVLEEKSSQEEVGLLERYPAYADYKKEVRGKLFPALVE